MSTVYARWHSPSRLLGSSTLAECRSCSVWSIIQVGSTPATLEPATSNRIAAATGLNERYVREWLGAMVTGRASRREAVSDRGTLDDVSQSWSSQDLLDVPNSSKRLTSGDARVSSKSWELQTRLHLLWTHVRQIGGAAQSTSFANMAGILALVNDFAETAKEKKEQKAIATFRLVLVLETNDDKRAALRILHETAVQQLVNAYEQLLAELLREHIAANTSVPSTLLPGVELRFEGGNYT